jgi:hypothetical protein
MALKFLDSFDHYTAVAAEANRKWTSTFATTRDTGLHGYGMRGSFLKGMLFGSTTLIMEMHIKRVLAEHLFAIRDTQQTEQIWCGYFQDGSIQVSRYGANAANDLIAQSAPDLIREGIWYHFGWKVFLHPTAGSVEVRLNGATIINVSGIPTISTYLSWSGAVGAFALGSNANATVFDDLVVMDDTPDGINDPRLPGGGGFTKFIGPVEIRVKRPSAPGSLTEWTPTPTVPNWQNVDDIESDDDATYNAADAATGVGKSDLFTMEDLASDEDVVAVQSLLLAKKTQEGVAAIASLVKDGGTTTVGATAYQPSAYSHASGLSRPAPAERSDPGGRNAIEYGYRRIV